MQSPTRQSGVLLTIVAATQTMSAPPDRVDPAATAVVGMVRAAPGAMAVFDAEGNCLAANPGFVVATAGRPNVDAVPTARRTNFSPDGTRTWTLVTLDAAATPQTLEMLAAVVDALPIALDARDSDGRYVFMNRYLAALHGVTPETAIGRTAQELFGAAEGGDTDAVGTRNSVQMSETTDAAGRHWLTSKVPLFSEGGTVWGAATLSVDIGERKRLEKGLRDAMAKAESGSRAKSRFLLAMSHELRTPLNAVIGFAELMQQEALGPLGHAEYIDYAGHILRSGMALLHMISNLLDFARAEAGLLDLRLTDVELVRLVRSTVSGAGDDAGAARTPTAEVSLDLPPAAVTVRGDEARLRQVLAGLLDNALKFTPAGGQVAVRLSALDDGAELQITDTGVGMTQAELRHVFEPLWQADGGQGRSRVGVGFGLRLARELVALHGGTLALDSRKGEGTRVTVRLPHHPPERAAVGR